MITIAVRPVEPGTILDLFEYECPNSDWVYIDKGVHDEHCSDCSVKQMLHER